MMASLEAVRVLNEAVAKAGVAKDGNLLKAYLKLLKLEYVDYYNQRSKALWGLHSSGWSNVIDKLERCSLCVTERDESGNILTISLT
ncbi:hypothetical protein [Klebsiella pneumoniae]|uniref:hypothetical protein n=1 Tax=Klebsiella pneumoniae TaxID=573 RepID=UPI0018C9B158|nr:hypothetical protein [Klebsiella pneumoniae]MBG9419940.1 hypothetical protein [Klebsiella pneumoniae]